MLFECRLCGSFADDIDLLHNICLNCIDNFSGVIPTYDCASFGDGCCNCNLVDDCLLHIEKGLNNAEVS